MLGGIAGCGLFSTVTDVSLLLHELMFNNKIFNTTTVSGLSNNIIYAE